MFPSLLTDGLYCGVWFSAIIRYRALRYIMRCTVQSPYRYWHWLLKETNARNVLFSGICDHRKSFSLLWRDESLHCSVRALRIAEVVHVKVINFYHFRSSRQFSTIYLSPGSFDFLLITGKMAATKQIKNNHLIHATTLRYRTLKPIWSRSQNCDLLEEVE